MWSQRTEEEEILGNEMQKLQNQIEQQKKLLNQMLKVKQSKMENQKMRLAQLSSLVKNQRIKETGENAKISKPQKTKTAMQRMNPTHQPLITTLMKHILKNRKKYYYKNRYFFNGYKFVLIDNGTALALVSTHHELTGKPVTDAISLPLFIVYSRRTYVKTPSGTFTLDGPDKIKLKKSNTIDNCIFFTRSGCCTKQVCPFKHDPQRKSLCPSLIKHGFECKNKNCHYSHTPTQFNSPSCKFYQIKQCNKENCIFTHKLENEKSPICREFAYNGYCDDGISCKFTHSFQCPELKEYGRCLLGTKCSCIHHEDNKTKNSLRNKDNDKVIQIVYDKNSESDDSCSGSDDNVELIVEPLDTLEGNSDYVRF